MTSWVPRAIIENGISILSSEVNQASHRQRMLQVMLVRGAPRVWGARNELQRAYLATEAWAAAIFAFTASRLKLAPFCIGGNSIAVIASFSTCCWTNTKRQNSYLNQSKYCCAPNFVPLSGQPVRSNGSRRRLVRVGTSSLVL